MDGSLVEIASCSKANCTPPLTDHFSVAVRRFFFALTQWHSQVMTRFHYTIGANVKQRLTAMINGRTAVCN